MRSTEASGETQCVIAVHSFRPRAAKAADALRFLTSDRRSVRASPGHLWSFMGIAGSARRSHVGLPPSWLARTGVVLWRDQATLDQFLLGKVARRWQANGQLSTMWGRPVGGHGPMIQRTMPDLSASGRTDGPVMVLTYLRRRAAQTPKFLIVEVPKSMRGLGGAAGLLSVTGGGSGLRGVTVSHWQDSKSMKAWAYNPEFAHGQSLVRQGGDRFPDWCFMRIKPLGAI